MAPTSCPEYLFSTRLLAGSHISGQVQGVSLKCTNHVALWLPPCTSQLRAAAVSRSCSYLYLYWPDKATPTRCTPPASSALFLPVPGPWQPCCCSCHLLPPPATSYRARLHMCQFCWQVWAECGDTLAMAGHIVTEENKCNLLHPSATLDCNGYF